MHQVHIPSLPWGEAKSPGGTFHSFFRNVSVALGGIRNGGLSFGGHPFDVQIRRIPPGAAVCPFHSHLAQWEFYLIQSGAGTVRAGDSREPVRTGDVFVHPPGEPHQLINTGNVDLEVLIVADNPDIDAFHYPDSNKWGLRPPGKYFRLAEIGYFDGEEAAVAGAPAYQPSASPKAGPIAPFTQRRTNLDALPWEAWDSPKGKFRAASKELSIAVGAKRNTPNNLGGHPFDLELGRLLPGECGCPYHSHASQWEFYIFLRGTVSVRTPEGTTPMKSGDVVLHPPGEAHQFTNTGTDEVQYLLIADNPPVDYWFYPDSNKWGLRAPRKFFRMAEADYWDGEE